MKAATIFQRAVGLLIIPLLLSCPLPSRQALAQDNGYLEPSETYSREELAQLLAPIALYPDTLLSKILMASTYPLDVIEADRWLKNNSGLRDQALDNALLGKEWDPSVKAICHFPPILALMSRRIADTTQIGNAFLAQEAEVMDMIQELRAQARAEGNLRSSREQNVIVEKETIVIEPANPWVIYVPYYDPLTVYGRWWYPAYQPYYWGPPGVSLGIGLSFWPGLYFSFAFGTWSYFDWHHHHIFLDVNHPPRFIRHDRWLVKPGRWYHVPSHRRGVAYPDKYTARKYGQYSRRFLDNRRDIRGFPQIRTRDWQDRRGQQRITRSREQSRRIQPDAGRRRIEPDRRQPAGIERYRQNRERRPLQSRTPQEKRLQQRIVRVPQRRDNAFNRIGEGRHERQSSMRGRSSRQGAGIASHGRSGGFSRSGHDHGRH